MRTRFKIESDIRDNLAMINASERVMELYKNALIPKARQDIDAALAQYASGRMEAASALAKLKAPFDYELTSWQQYVEREKAIARIKVFTGCYGGQVMKIKRWIILGVHLLVAAGAILWFAVGKGEKPARCRPRGMRMGRPCCIAARSRFRSKSRLRSRSPRTSSDSSA